jgi:hypothetical protein
MAEINIQKKSTNPMWWVLVILAVVIVGWLLMGRNRDRAPETSFINEPSGAPIAALQSGAVGTIDRAYTS